MQFKGKSSKASSKKCYWENAFPLWCVQLVSWLRLANCSHWFLETSWFFSPQSLPYDNNPRGYSAQWKQKSLMWMAAAGSGLFLLSWWTVCCCIHFGSKSTWRYSELTGQKNSNIGSTLIYRCAKLNTSVLYSENATAVNILYCFKDLIAAGCFRF